MKIKMIPLKDEALHTRLKMHATEKRISITDLVASLIREYLDRSNNGPTKKGKS